MARRPCPFLCFAFLVVIAGGAAATPAAPPITSFQFAGNSVPVGIATGPDGNLWVVDGGLGSVHKMNPSGALIGEFQVDFPKGGIAVGPDGNLWLVASTGVDGDGHLFGDQILRLSPQGALARFPIGDGYAGLVAIAVGPDGNMWFTEAGANKIGRISPAGAVQEFALPRVFSQPGAITAAPDGNLWFLEDFYGLVGRMTPSGQLTGEFALRGALQTGGHGESSIVSGPDGNLWVTEYGGGQIARVTTAGSVTEFAVAPAPSGIATGPDGNLWFIDTSHPYNPYYESVGSITPDGLATLYPIWGDPRGITLGPDGNLWLANPGGSSVDRVVPACVAGGTRLCLDSRPGDQRWQLGVTFRGAGVAQAVSLASLGVSHGGLFAFFDRTNPEVLIKILNGCALNGRFWVFSSATTNVAFTVSVRDTRSGAFRTYHNAEGVPALPVQDTSAFACEKDDRTVGPGSGTPEEELAAWVPGAGGAPASSPLAVLTSPSRLAESVSPAATGCATGGRTLCIGSRFSFEVSVGTAPSGSGTPIGLDPLGVSAGGLFWFYSADNPELLVKVVDGCLLNRSFWVFASATTDAGFTLTVRDTVTGQTKSYSNRQGTAATPILDVAALPCR
jgi:streptogramin lyase